MARLIDADVLREYWHISEKCEECHWNNRDCSRPPYYSLRDICAAIDEVPTIDAIPVEWLEAQIVPYRDKLRNEAKGVFNATVREILYRWQKEQEAR